MKYTLSTSCINVPATATPLEIRELYESYILNEKASFYKDDIRAVKYSLLTKEQLCLDKTEVIAFGRIKDISREISSLDSSDALYAFSGLCAKSVTFTQSSKDEKVYGMDKVVPSLVMNFCQNSRVHSGLSLMKRALRHSVYVDEPDILDAHYKVGWFEEKLFLEIFLSSKSK